MAWPGLNSQLMARGKMMEIEERPITEYRQQQLAKFRDEKARLIFPTAPPLLRGYAGKRAPGTRLGPPDPIGNCE